MKETTAMVVSKDMIEYMKYDKGFADHIVSMLSRELADRLIQILDSEGEVIVKQSDLIVSEVMEWNQVEYRRFLELSHLVRCKDCKHKPSGDGANHNIDFPDDLCPCQCEDFWYSWIPTDDWFCGNGERRE